MRRRWLIPLTVFAVVIHPTVILLDLHLMATRTDYYDLGLVLLILELSLFLPVCVYCFLSLWLDQRKPPSV